MTEEKKNKPLEKFRAGSVSATIWNNKTEKDGKEIEFLTISVDRYYKTKDKEGNTNSMRINDLPRLELVCKKAFEYCLTRNSNEQPDEA